MAPVSNVRSSPRAVATTQTSKTSSAAKPKETASTRAAGWNSGGISNSYSQYAKGIRSLAQDVKARRVSPSQVEARMGALPKPSNAAMDGLWAPNAGPLRSELCSAMKALAAVAPDAKVAMYSDDPKLYRPSVKETAMQMDFNMTLVEKRDGLPVPEGKLKQLAADFKKAFPASPFVQGFESQAARS